MPDDDSGGGVGPGARLLLAGYLVSAIGSGMVFPYLAVYVIEVRHQDGTTAATTLAAVALGSVAGSLLAGAGTDGLGPRVVGAAGIVAQGLGYAALGASSTAVSLVVTGAVVGLGAGAFLAVLSPSISALVPPAQHRRAFALRYTATNLGIGIGAVLAAVALDGFSPAGFRIAYAVNGATYAVLLVCFWRALRFVPAAPSARTDRRGRSRWRGAVADRRLRLLLVAQTLLVAAGFSQVQSVLPLLLSVKLDRGVGLISTMLALNCLGIVLLQPWVVRAGAGLSDRRMLAWVGVLWATAFCVGAAAVLGGAVGIAGLVAFFVIFTLGECFYAPSFQPLLVRIAPGDRLGHYSGLSSSLWGTTTLLAPPAGVMLVSSDWSVLFWPICALGCLLASVSALRLAEPGAAEGCEGRAR